MLWERSLVMYDVETESYWSHILGKAMAGELLDTQLDVVPSVLTDWSSWRGRHPDTTVLWMVRSAQQFVAENLPLENLVIGAKLTGAPYAWTYDYLTKNAPVITTLSETPILIVFDSDSKAALMFDRRVGSDVIELELRGGRLIDPKSSSAWDATSGRAIDGANALTPIPAIPSYRVTWESFHPDSVFFDAT